MSEWYAIRNIDTLDTPALVIYPERVRKNIGILKSFVDDVARLRPHVKTNKCPQVTRLMIDAGISKFKCATIAEAEMLALEGAQRAPGLAATLLAQLTPEHERGLGQWQSQWFTLRELALCASSALAAMAEALGGLEVDEAAMQRS